MVIEGGGWVQVGDERARVAAGEAVLWPADVIHGAWTELSEMRAIVVELAGPDDAHLRGIIDVRPLPLPAGSGAGEAAAAPGDHGRRRARARAGRRAPAPPPRASRCRSAGLARAAADPRLGRAIDRVLARQDVRGRRANRSACAGPMVVDVDIQGGPSTWVTLRACRVPRAIAESRSTGAGSRTGA